MELTINQPPAPLRFPWTRYGAAALVVLSIYAIHEYIPPSWHSGPVVCLITATLAAVLIECMRRQANKVREAVLETRAYARKLEEEITRRERLEAELIQARQSAEEANATKDRFLATLSHELRTPLAPVLAVLPLLQEREDVPADAREDLSLIRRNAQLEARLIDDMLDVSRIAGGKLELRAEETDLRSVLGEVVRMCQGAAESKQLNLVLHDDATVSQRVWGDPARLAQVFWNLINNAVKFTPERGSVTVRTYVERSTCEPDTLVAEVHDTGAGIAPELLHRVFIPFEQGGRAVTRQFGGLGLGLAISKALVELHGGTIEAYSEGKDRGSTFRVGLPLLRNASVPSADTGSNQCECRSAKERSGSLRLLLVEDHRDTAEVMKRLLRRGGHQVETAGDVATALDIALREDFDVLISDLGLPDGSGLDLMRELNNRGRNLPGIALTGHGREQDVQQSREAGFVAHVVKPDVDRLLALVENAAKSKASAA